jgi:hypothetical protein
MVLVLEHMMDKVLKLMVIVEKVDLVLLHKLLHRSLVLDLVLVEVVVMVLVVIVVL